MKEVHENEAKVTNSTRVLYYDVLNILACLSVIALHHNGLVHHYSDSMAWKESLVVECIFYWAVPIFCMLSGATLLGYRKRYSTREFLKKRAVRVMIPWLCWSLFMLCFKLYTKQLSLENEAFTLGLLLNMIINNKIESTYYFFNAIFACYLSMPVFSLLIEKKSILWYTVALNFIFVSIKTLIGNFGGGFWNLGVPIVGGCLIFFLLGYLIDNMEFSLFQRRLLYLLALLGVVFRYIFTIYFSTITEAVDTRVWGYVQFHSVILAVVVFVFFKNLDLKRIPLQMCPLIS